MLRRVTKRTIEVDTRVAEANGGPRRSYSGIGSLPPLTYLSFDSVAEGVGASQVTPYVEALARRGMDITLHSFESSTPTSVRSHFEGLGVRWEPHDFGRFGQGGGAARV